MLKSPDFIRRIGAKTFLWIKLNRILKSIEKTVFDKKSHYHETENGLKSEKINILIV